MSAAVQLHRSCLIRSNGSRLRGTAFLALQSIKSINSRAVSNLVLSPSDDNSIAEGKELIAEDLGLLNQFHLAKMLFNSAGWLQQYTSNGRN